MSLKDDFEQATKDVQQLTYRPDNNALLQLYAYFKQATQGDVQGKRPGMMDLKGRKKYDAWAEISGTPSQTAMQSYIDLVRQLQK